MLPTKTIYIESRWKTKDSVSHTDFKYDLGISVNMPEGAHFYMDDVNIPNSWYSVEEGVNNKLYIRYTELAYGSKPQDVIIYIPSDVYNGDSFIAVVSRLLNAVTHNNFQVSYDPNRNKLNIATTTVEFFEIFTDDQLRDPTRNWGLWSTPLNTYYDKTRLCSIHEGITNYGHKNDYRYVVPYASGFLDFQR